LERRLRLFGRGSDLPDTVYSLRRSTGEV